MSSPVFQPQTTVTDFNPYEVSPSEAAHRGRPELPITLYWTLKSVPGLEDLPWQERGQMFRKVLPTIMKRWQVWAALLVMPLSIGLAGYAIYTTRVGLDFQFLLVGLAGGIGSIPINQVSIYYAIPLIRAERERMEQEQRDAEAAEQAFRESAVRQRLKPLSDQHHSENASE